jgi:hypothetical protein
VDSSIDQRFNVFQVASHHVIETACLQFHWFFLLTKLFNQFILHLANFVQMRFKVNTNQVELGQVLQAVVGRGWVVIVDEITGIDLELSPVNLVDLSSAVRI